MTKKATEQRSSRRVSDRQGFRSLLVAVDLTPVSDRVLGRLALLPLAGDARVTLLHVVPRGLTAREQRDAERDAIRMLAEEARHRRNTLPAGVTIVPVVKFGRTAKTISSYARTMRAEVVVMGRGSGNSLRDVFVGSTAEQVIRQAEVPTLVVRLPDRSRYARPALAIDMDEAASRAVAVMLRLLQTPRPPVAVIHAFDAPYRSFFYPSLAEDSVDERMDDLHLKAARDVASVLRKALAKANVPLEHAPSWKTHIRFGSPRIVVDRAVRKIGADLLVLGTRGHSGAPLLFLGTVAGDLLRQSRCDVLIVPPLRR